MNKHLKTYVELLHKIRPILTDVSLRDGIQSALPSAYPTAKKKELLHHIMTQTMSRRIEVGSFVSPKVLPIMGDTLDLYKFGAQWYEITNHPCNCMDICKRETTAGIICVKSSPMIPQLGVLVPNMEKMELAIEHKIPFVSFITSVSDEFQRRNIKKSLEETKQELQQMITKMHIESPHTYTKLYVSCINKCPIIGEIAHNKIVDEMLYYSNNFKFDELCLSDTCGTLTEIEFKYIISTMLQLGVPTNKISLHLHVLPANETEIQKILFYCFEKGINKFDVSLLDSGGCSVTMGKHTKPNLSHEYLFRILNMYLCKKLSE